MTNPYVSLTFLVIVGIAAAGYGIIRGFLPAWGRALLLATISVLVLSRLPEGREFLPYALAYSASVAALAWLLSCLRTEAPRKVVFAAAILLAVAVMLVFHFPVYTAALLGERPALKDLSLIPFIGLSYMTFRALDCLIAARANAVRIDPRVVLAYLLFAPPFVAGPINRFIPFVEDIGARLTALDAEGLRDGLLRLGFGLIKVLFLSRLAYYNSLRVMSPDDPTLTSADIVIGVYAYYLYIYLDFSGYCDIAIVAARFFGVRVPENFRWPLVATSIQDFWNRWHISLSHWCRDHIFFPLVRVLSLRTPWLPSLAATCSSIFVTFLFVGAWHGDALNWVLYGAYHGLGLVICVLYRQAMQSWAPDLYERLQSSTPYLLICCVGTTCFVAWGLLLTFPLETAAQFLARL